MMAPSTLFGPQALRAGWLSCAVSCLLFMGCASRGPNVTDDNSAAAPVAPVGAAALSNSGLAQFETRQREALETAARRGRWGEVLWTLDVLQALRPNDTSLAPRRAAAERAAQEAAAERMRQAKLVQQRGDAEGAVRHYLEVLSLQPQHTEAADALRTLERERVARHHLGVSARAAFARNPTTPAKKNGKGSDAARNELEHASMMAAQGDVKGAIALLKPSAESSGDAGTRRLLADLYLREAEVMWPNQRSAAITAAERGLKIDPQHQRLRERLSGWREAVRTSQGGPQAVGMAATGKEVNEGAMSAGKSTR
jgi:tetratricopeptide (TPR) repeat protein